MSTVLWTYKGHIFTEMPRATLSKILYPYSNRHACAFVLTGPNVEGKMRTMQTTEMGCFSAD